MKSISLLCLFILSCAAQCDTFSDRQLQMTAKNYQLNYTLDISNKKLTASGLVTVENISNLDATHIPLRLYRMLNVSKITDLQGKPLDFTQHILGNDHWPALQTNFLEIQLSSPLKPSEQVIFNIEFEGLLRGYSETGMNYVKDSITDAFTILRADAFAYPMVSYPNETVNQQARFWLHHFDYDVTITVPNEYTVANGGNLLEKTTSGKQTSYRYTNKLPAWRMDFAIARYQIYTERNYTVFSWESESVSKNLLDQILKVTQLYTHWFGPLKHDLGYVFIEVPENYGAQADVTSVIQDAAGFSEYDRVFHEISHQWNVKSLDQYSPRWNEGLATFLEEMTLDRLEKPGHLNAQTQKVYAFVKERFVNDEHYRKTSFKDYGKAGLNSYSVGMLFFRLMHDIVGDDEFNNIIGGFYQKYYDSGATTEEFINYAKKNRSGRLDKLFDEWAYSAKFTEQLITLDSYFDLLSHYQSGKR